MSMLVKKRRSNKTYPKQSQHFSSGESRIELLVKKYHAKVPSKTLANNWSREKTIDLLVMKFLYGKAA